MLVEYCLLASGAAAEAAEAVPEAAEAAGASVALPLMAALTIFVTA